MLKKLQLILKKQVIHQKTAGGLQVRQIDVLLQLFFHKTDRGEAGFNCFIDTFLQCRNFWVQEFKNGFDLNNNNNKDNCNLYF